MDCIIIMILKFNPKTTSKYIQDVRKNRRSEEGIDQDQLVEVDSALYKIIKEIVVQKSNKNSNNFLMH